MVFEFVMKDEKMKERKKEKKIEKTQWDKTENRVQIECVYNVRP